MKPSLNELIDWGGNRSNSDVIEQPPGLEGNTNTLIKYHAAHRLAFTFEYSGIQPTIGKRSKFGRYSKTYRYRTDYPEYSARVFAYPRSLLVWIKKPKGTRTVEQLIEARRLARECVNSIAFKHRLTLMREKGAGFSEHTIEDKALDRVIRPLVKEEPDLMRERCGITENLTSHRKKLEHTDRDRRPEQPRAKDRVMALEDILYGKAATKDDIKELREDIRAIVPELRELTATLKDVVLGSVKPPGKPPDTWY
jgi:hypothetical protein